MENEPSRERQNQPGFKIEFESGLEVYCWKGNTMGFLHTQEPYGDHIFVYKTDDNNEVTEGDYVFRDQLENFDNIIKYMKDNGFQTYESQRLSEHDREAYEEYLFKRKPVELPEHELTPRQQRLLGYWAHYLTKIESDFFEGEGELFL